MLLGEDEMMRVRGYFRTFFPGQRAEHGSRASDRVAGTFGRMRPPIRRLCLLLINAAALPDILGGPTAGDLPPD